MQAITADTVIAYITHDDRPMSVKPAQSEATWRLVVNISHRQEVVYKFCKLLSKTQQNVSAPTLRAIQFKVFCTMSAPFVGRPSTVICINERRRAGARDGSAGAWSIGIVVIINAVGMRGHGRCAGPGSHRMSAPAMTPYITLRGAGRR